MSIYIYNEKSLHNYDINLINQLELTERLSI